MMGSPWAQGAPQFDPSSLLAGLGQSAPQDGLTRAMNNPPDAMTAAMNRAPSPLDQPQPASGMFAARRPGVDWGQLGAMILAANGNPLGTAAMQQQMERQREQALLTRQSLIHEQQQQFELQRQMGLRDYENAHQPPPEVEREAAYYESIGRHDLAEATRTNHAMGPATLQPVYNPNTGQYDTQLVRGGMLMGQPGGAPHIMTDEEMRAHMSGQPTASQAQGGASPSNGSGGFRG